MEGDGECLLGRWTNASGVRIVGNNQCACDILNLISMITKTMQIYNTRVCCDVSTIVEKSGSELVVKIMEDERTFNPVPENINQGVVRYLRDAPPAHYSLKIESFSRLVDLEAEKYESVMFDACGYKWRLVLYPNGNAKRGGEGHREDRHILPLGWEAYVTYKMFVFDHDKDQYLTIQDDPVNQIRRFHRAKKESGFDRLISLDTFNAATNGYLIDDSCVFGVEVYDVVKNTGNGEIIKMIEHPEKVTFDWKICEFSTICREKLPGEELKSEEFTAGESEWRLSLYPNGDSRTKEHISLFLVLVESPTSVKKVLAEYSLLIKNQISNRHHKLAGPEDWFTCDVSNSWGWPTFKLLSHLQSDSSGFVVNDTILLQAEVKIKTEVTSFS